MVFPRRPNILVYEVISVSHLEKRSKAASSAKTALPGVLTPFPMGEDAAVSDEQHESIL